MTNITDSELQFLRSLLNGLYIDPSVIGLRFLEFQNLVWDLEKRREPFQDAIKAGAQYMSDEVDKQPIDEIAEEVKGENVEWDTTSKPTKIAGAILISEGKRISMEEVLRSPAILFNADGTVHLVSNKEFYTMKPENEMIETKYVNGAPLIYDRDKKENYGNSGRYIMFKFDPDFYEQLRQCVEELEIVLPYTLNGIFTAGAYVDKPGYHGKGRAFDLDGLRFTDGGVITTKDFLTQRRLYLLIETVLRKHFGTVLGYTYNKAHEDHWHIDNGTRVGFSKKSKSRVEYLQCVLNTFWDCNVVEDGLWGPETKQALASFEWFNGFKSVERWMAFLNATIALYEEE